LGSFFYVDPEEASLDQQRRPIIIHSLRPGVLFCSFFSSLLLKPLRRKDPDAGGIADRPGDMVDVFHTLFGVAGQLCSSFDLGRRLIVLLPIGLSLLGFPGLDDIDPVYCMPASLIEKKGLKKDWAALPRRGS